MSYEEDTRPNPLNENPTAFESQARGENLRIQVFNQHKEFVQVIWKALNVCSSNQRPEGTPNVPDPRWTKNRAKEVVLCIPKVKYRDQSIRGVILKQAH